MCRSNSDRKRQIILRRIIFISPARAPLAEVACCGSRRYDFPPTASAHAAGPRPARYVRQRQAGCNGTRSWPSRRVARFGGARRCSACCTALMHEIYGERMAPAVAASCTHESQARPGHPSVRVSPTAAVWGSRHLSPGMSRHSARPALPSYEWPAASEQPKRPVPSQGGGLRPSTQADKHSCRRGTGSRHTPPCAAACRRSGI